MSYKWNVWSLKFLTFTKSLNKVERKLVFKNKKKKQNKKKRKCPFSVLVQVSGFLLSFILRTWWKVWDHFDPFEWRFQVALLFFRPLLALLPLLPTFFSFFDIYIYDAQFSCFKWSFPKNWTAEREKKTRTRTRNMYIFCFKTIEICFDDAVNCMIASYEWLVPLFHIPLKYYKCSQCVLYT